ncbi:MAG TPA: hypothetical protein ACHBX0_13845 [Arsenophonus sp.]
MAKFAKCAIGILTLGMGYGILYLIERYSNVNPKIQQFCHNTKVIANELSQAIEDGKDNITVTLDNGQQLTIQQDGCNLLLLSQDGQTQMLNEMNLEKLYNKIINDMQANSGIYGIELSKEVTVNGSSEPLTILELVELFTNKTSYDDYLLLRKSPSGNYFYLAKKEEVNESDRLQSRAKQAAESIGGMLGIDIDQNFSVADLCREIKSRHIPVSPEINQPHAFNTLVCSTPTEVTMRWITTLDRALQNAANPQQQELITHLLQAQKNRWLTHDMSLEKTVKSLIDDSNTLRNHGLNHLADRAYCKNSTETDLVSLLPGNEKDLPLTRLHDNIYGRYFESVWIGELVNNPPQEVLAAMHSIGTGMADLLEKQTTNTQKKVINYLKYRVNKDPRFWFNQVEGISQFPKLEWPASKKLLMELLRNEITSGFQSIAIPYLSVKMINGFSQKCDMASPQWSWLKQINLNYNYVLSPHRGRTEVSQPQNGKIPNIPKHAVSSAAGITLRHQPNAVSESWMTITDRPALHYKPEIQAPTIPILKALLNGVPFSAGISGSTNIMLGIVSYLQNEQKRNIDSKSALLGTMMFMTYDGGHSLHEALWTANQFGPKIGLDFSTQLNEEAVELDPLNFVADYQLFANMYKNTGCEEAMTHSMSLAFEKTIAHCKTLVDDNVYN